MFEDKIKEYEQLRRQYHKQIVQKMNPSDFRKTNEILFSAHSCAIEGNTFSVDETRELKEKGLSDNIGNHSLLEAFEILDHFKAFEYVCDNLSHPLDEDFLREVNRLVTQNTITYRSPDAVAGEYTNCDMAAGDTFFGEHEQLIAQVPKMLQATERALKNGMHPMIVSARFHGFFIYLHPFRDGNGRTARLLSNYLLMRSGHPLLIIEKEDRPQYISALRCIRTEGTDEFLVDFFFKTAIRGMNACLEQKNGNTRRMMTIMF